MGCGQSTSSQEPSYVTARQEEKCRAEKASPTPRVKKLNRGMRSSKPAAKSIQAVGHCSERAPLGRFDAMQIGHRSLQRISGHAPFGGDLGRGGRPVQNARE